MIHWTLFKQQFYNNKLSEFCFTHSFTFPRRFSSTCHLFILLFTCFFFYSFFLAQSQIVQTQSINSGSLVLFSPPFFILLQTLAHTAHTQLASTLNRCQENKRIFFLSAKHTTSNQFIHTADDLGGENRTLFIFKGRYVNDFCFAVSFICSY